jgi:hypothetical protein
MGRRSMNVKSSHAWIVVALLTVPGPAFAEHRLAVEPSLDVIEVLDDNLNFSPDDPVRDRIRRITPTLALRFDSPRCSARSSFGIDSEHFATHSGLDNDRARERARIGIQYLAGPRLTLILDSAYLDTSTLTDLNVETGLSASRVRGRRLDIAPSARFRISPRLTVTASAASMSSSAVNGIGIRELNQTLMVERGVTPRDRFSVAYEHSQLVFREETVRSMNAHVLLAGWRRDLGPHDYLLFRAGPRMSDGSIAPDLSAFLTHNWRFTSMTVSLMRNQATVIGYSGAVETESLQANMSYAPSRRLTAYATPAVFRSTHHQLQGSVYRVAFGARYEVLPLVGVDMAYSLDRQNGAIDPLRSNTRFSHATLSVGLTTRWKTADHHGAQ